LSGIHLPSFQYNRLSELTGSSITNIGGGNWNGSYVYAKNGDMVSRTINSITETFGYTGNQMANANGITLNYDLNGNMKTLPVSEANQVVYNWDNKLRSAQKGSSTMSLRAKWLGGKSYTAPNLCPVPSVYRRFLGFVFI